MNPAIPSPAPAVQVGIGVIVVRGGRVLLGRRRGAHGAGNWALPGGHLEFGESPEACAARELAEETGLRASAWRRAPYTADVIADAVAAAKPEPGRHYITLFMLADGVTGDPQRLEPQKCDGWSWHDWDALPEPLFAPLATLRKSGWRPAPPATAAVAPARGLPEQPPGVAPLVRRLVPDDAPLYRALMLEAYERHTEAFSSSAAERAALPMAWWQARLAGGDDVPQRVIGAWRGDRLAGVAGLSFETGEKLRHKATLFGMAVAEDFRRQGIGEALVQAVLAEAQAHPGTRLVQLTVSDGNRAARALYERCGFAVFGIEPRAVAVGDGYVAKCHMWVDLEAPR
jgi:ADP-ribose pyrophosphatase YjhB (NUDIX family)/ribosomal protein S18 acetylase RimI-like enzyme